MSKGPWKRCKISGISLVKLRGTDYLSDTGEFKTWWFSDCDLFDVRSIAAADPDEGFTRVDDFLKRVVTDPSSPIHLHQLINDDGHGIGYATAQNSAERGWKNYRSAAKARQLAGKRPAWDVSSASVR